MASAAGSAGRLGEAGPDPQLPQPPSEGYTQPQDMAAPSAIEMTKHFMRAPI